MLCDEIIFDMDDSPDVVSGDSHVNDNSGRTVPVFRGSVDSAIHKDGEAGGGGKTKQNYLYIDI